ncbi:uncharacterized protein LOC108673266 [Hyalella azteca]|uniref:Uncharacterized protein LOC108673266 n=1 Tax=Hyalella azteca TaxID=294128 RepID=A0A8B7NS36_HYAAZ|nr:uncharacterized protein LOC108673266 [Hyalella azteca]
MPILGGCLCFDLPTGSKIIGVIYLVSALLNSLMLTVVTLMLWVIDLLPQVLAMLETALLEGAHQVQDGSHDAHDHGAHDHGAHEHGSDDYEDSAEFRNGTDASVENIKEALEVLKSSVMAVKVAVLVLLVLAILSVITSSMLIHGVRKNSRSLLVPWLVQEVLHIVVFLAAVVVMFGLFGVHEVAWAIAVPLLVVMCVQVFFMCVVASQHQALGLIRMHDEMCMK